MKTTTKNLEIKSLSLRAIQVVGLVLALIVWASWIAPSGRTSSRTTSLVSRGKVSPVSSSAFANTRSRSPSPASQLTADGLNAWTTNGPYGGIIHSLAIDPINPATIYAGTDSSGVFKTTDAGASWNGANGGLTNLYVRALAIDPHNPNTIFANTDEAMFKSTDGGASWRPSNTGLPHGYDLTTPVMIDPIHSNTVYVGAAYTGTGVFKSNDGGASWGASSQGLSNLSVTSLAIDPSNSITLYAGTYGFGGGVFKSTDAGNTWNPVAAIVTSAGGIVTSVYALSIDPGSPRTLYAASYVGLFKSIDGGKSWNQTNAGLPTPAYAPVALVIDPRSSNTIYIAFSDVYSGPVGIFKSVNGGASWSPFNDGLAGGVETLALDAHNPNTIYAGTDGSGIFKSENGATRWSAVNSGVRDIHVTSVAVDPGNAGILYSGTDHGVFKSSNGGASWDSVNSSQYVTTLSIASTEPNIIYAGIDYGGCCGGVLKSTDSGASWTSETIYGYGVNALATDPGNPDTVYASADYCSDGGCDYSIFKSTDGGANWNSIVSGSGPLQIDVKDPRTIYLGSWGAIGKSTDAGANWNFFHQGLPDTSINALAIDPTESNSIYAGTGDYYSLDKTGVFKSTDGGATWKGIGPASTVSALAVDSGNPNTIYAGTARGGVFKSTDAGATWSEFNAGLTNLTVNALAIDSSGRHLHAATPAGVFDYQYPATCAYSISALGQSFSADSAIGSVKVTTSPVCSWQAISDASWITINSGSSGSGDGTVNFSVAANTDANPRTGTLTIAGQTFIVNQAGLQSPNPIDDAQFFVRQHYVDFLNREPDQDGLAFWIREIVACGVDKQCIEVKRISVSAAYFLSIEFQQTGYLVYRIYKTSFGNLPDSPVPIKLNEFVSDTQKLGRGVIVNQTGWEQLLESNKQAFAAEFVQRLRFASAYPASMTREAFIDRLFANADVVPSSMDRAAAIAEFGSATTTADVAARARALRRVAENSTLVEQEFNRAFVLMQYFGYLRRNPNDPPEPTLDFQGYNFWLNKLNSSKGDFVSAEMVKAFITSIEYRHRFGP